jgi:antitoxin ParD1/3/4
MQQHVKRSIDLASDMDKLVSDAVRRGDYSSASEVVDEALRLWSEKQDNFGYTLAELRALVNAGIESGPGKHASIEDIKAEARSRLNARQTSE